MLNWNFNANDYEEKSFEVLPVGDYRVRIASAEEKTSKAGNPMVELKFDVSGKNSKLFFYIVIDQSSADKIKQTNQRLGEFYECFGIPMGNLDPRTWVGKVGACRVKHEDYNGEKTAKVHYLLNKKKQATLPAWVEPTASSSSTNEAPMPDPTFPPLDDVPFDTSSLI